MPGADVGRITRTIEPPAHIFFVLRLRVRPNMPTPQDFELLILMDRPSHA